VYTVSVKWLVRHFRWGEEKQVVRKRTHARNVQSQFARMTGPVSTWLACRWRGRVLCVLHAGTEVLDEMTGLNAGGAFGWFCGGWRA